MSNTFAFWGQPARTSDDPRGAIGVTINGRNVRVDHWEAAKRIAAAGPSGLAEEAAGGVPLADVSFLRTAGIEVRDVGFRRYAIDHLPKPSAFIQRDDSASTQVARGGGADAVHSMYGMSGRAHDPYSRR